MRVNGELKSINLRRIARSKGKKPANGLEHSPKPSREVGMTRTDVVASSRPQKAGTAMMRKGSPKARKLVVLSVAFALMMALSRRLSVFAAEDDCYERRTRRRARDDDVHGAADDDHDLRRRRRRRRRHQTRRRRRRLARRLKNSRAPRKNRRRLKRRKKNRRNRLSRRRRRRKPRRCRSRASTFAGRSPRASCFWRWACRSSRCSAASVAATVAEPLVKLKQTNGRPSGGRFRVRR